MSQPTLLNDLRRRILDGDNIPLEELHAAYAQLIEIRNANFAAARANAEAKAAKKAKPKKKKEPNELDLLMQAK